MKNYLLRNEKVITDDGYVDPECVRKSSVPEDSREAHYEIRAKLENVNWRIEQFLVLKKGFDMIYGFTQFAFIPLQILLNFAWRTKNCHSSKMYFYDSG